jgi:hypothetical protein
MNSSERKLPKLTKLLQHEERLGMSLLQEYSGNLTYFTIIQNIPGHWVSKQSFFVLILTSDCKY